MDKRQLELLQMVKDTLRSVEQEIAATLKTLDNQDWINALSSLEFVKIAAERCSVAIRRNFIAAP